MCGLLTSEPATDTAWWWRRRRRWRRHARTCAVHLAFRIESLKNESGEGPSNLKMAGICAVLRRYMALLGSKQKLDTWDAARKHLSPEWWKNVNKGGNREKDFSQTYLENTPGSFAAQEQALQAFVSKGGQTGQQLLEHAVQQWLDGTTGGGGSGGGGSSAQQPRPLLTRRQQQPQHQQQRQGEGWADSVGGTGTGTGTGTARTSPVAHSVGGDLMDAEGDSEAGQPVHRPPVVSVLGVPYMLGERLFRLSGGARVYAGVVGAGMREPQGVRALHRVFHHAAVDCVRGHADRQARRAGARAGLSAAARTLSRGAGCMRVGA
jgi:hypothetical protein